MSDNPNELPLEGQPEGQPEEGAEQAPLTDAQEEVITRAVLNTFQNTFQKNIADMIDKKLEVLKGSFKQSMTDRDKLLREEIAAATKEYESLADAAGLSSAAKASGLDRIKSEVIERHRNAAYAEPAQERQPASPPDRQEVERVLTNIRRYEAKADVFLNPLDEEFDPVRELGDNPSPSEYEKVYLQAVQAKAKRMGVTIVPQPAASTAARSASVLSGSTQGGTRLEQLTRRLQEIQNLDPFFRNPTLTKEREEVQREMGALERT